MPYPRAVPSSSAKASAGVTLVELMIIVALLALFATIALPNLGSLLHGNQAEAQAQAVRSFLQFARAEAINQRKPIKVTPGTGNSWVATARVNGRDEVLRQLDPLPSQLQMTADPAVFSFQANGTASDGARFVVCDGAASAGNGYLIDVQRSGAVKLHARGADLSSCDASTEGTGGNGG